MTFFKRNDRAAFIPPSYGTFFCRRGGQYFVCSILTSEELPCSLQIPGYCAELSLDTEREEAVAALLLLFRASPVP